MGHGVSVVVAQRRQLKEEDQHRRRQLVSRMLALYPVAGEILKESLIVEAAVIVDQAVVTVELGHTGIAVELRINQAHLVFLA